MTRKKRSGTINEEKEPPKKKVNLDKTIYFWKIPFMVRVQMCTHLDLKTMRALKKMNILGEEVIRHYWKSQRTLSFSPNSLRRYFSYIPNVERFKNLFEIRKEIEEIFSWLQPDSIRELDLRGVSIVDWTFLQETVENEHGPEALADILKKTQKLRLEGSYLNSEDIINSSQILPSIEFVSISEKSFSIFDESDAQLPKMELIGKIKKKKRQNMLKILCDCFPRLRIVKFY